jgi:hypothetical protein
MKYPFLPEATQNTGFYNASIIYRNHRGNKTKKHRMSKNPGERNNPGAKEKEEHETVVVCQ